MFASGHLEQVIETHPKHPAHGHQLVHLGHRAVHLPAGHRLAGHPQLFAQSLLGEIVLLSQFLNPLSQRCLLYTSRCV